MRAKEMNGRVVAKGKGQSSASICHYALHCACYKVKWGQLAISTDKEAHRLEDSSTRIWSRRVQPRCNVCSDSKTVKVQDYFGVSGHLQTAERASATNAPQGRGTIARGQEEQTYFRLKEPVKRLRQTLHHPSL